jgi:hypothetical protein
MKMPDYYHYDHGKTLEKIEIDFVNGEKLDDFDWILNTNSSGNPAFLMEFDKSGFITLIN